MHVSPEYLLPLALYAETHFRFFPGMPSALFRKAPEIIFDLPRRIIKNQDLPLVLLINDIHKYPITPVSVQVSISHKESMPQLFTFKELQQFKIEHALQNQQQAFIIPIERHLLHNGEVLLNAKLTYKKVKNNRTAGPLIPVLNDNLPTSSKLPFRCTITDEDFPGNELCTFGDLHSHSIFSRSHVEFGPPLQVIEKVASSSGLHFAAVTDHSYDLACDPQNYLQQDRSLGMWKLYKESMSKVNGAALLIQGEEISCLNSKGLVVHLCGLGVKNFIPGTLDGARQNKYSKTQPTIIEAIRQVHSQGGIAFAAHPGSKAGFMQQVFLSRGEWSEKDLFDDLDGIQAVNSGYFDSWQRGKQLWISMLQRGLRVPLLAGSDAHGDFNRYRAIGKPFMQVHEGPERYMGFVRTGLYGKHRTVEEILNAIKNCATFVTNGPFAAINFSGSRADSIISNQTISNPSDLFAVASSNVEFGQIRLLKVFCGQNGSTTEKAVLSRNCPPECNYISERIPILELPDKCYLRVEVIGKSPRNIKTVAATSACFIQRND